VGSCIKERIVTYDELRKKLEKRRQATRDATRRANDRIRKQQQATRHGSWPAKWTKETRA